MGEKILSVVEHLSLVGGLLFSAYKGWVAWLKVKHYKEHLKKSDEEINRLRNIIDGIDRR